MPKLPRLKNLGNLNFIFPSNLPKLKGDHSQCATTIMSSRNSRFENGSSFTRISTLLQTEQIKVSGNETFQELCNEMMIAKDLQISDSDAFSILCLAISKIERGNTWPQSILNTLSKLLERSENTFMEALQLCEFLIFNCSLLKANRLKNMTISVKLPMTANLATVNVLSFTINSVQQTNVFIEIFVETFSKIISSMKNYAILGNILSTIFIS
jgi:hypothetical protein